MIIISPDAWQQVYSHARDRDSKVKVRRYHICKRRDKTTTPYLKKDQAVSATFLLQAQLQPVASTNLTDDQLDRLALFCRRKFTVYQLIRQDCLQFAKSMTIQIAVSENGRSLDDVAEELGVSCGYVLK